LVPSTRGPWPRQTGRVADEQRPDEVARLLAHGCEVGKALGEVLALARPQAVVCSPRTPAILYPSDFSS
jgi:hypothetical protein